MILGCGPYGGLRARSRRVGDETAWCAFRDDSVTAVNGRTGARLMPGLPPVQAVRRAQ